MDKSNKKIGLYMAFEFDVTDRSQLSKESNGIIKKIINQIETFEKYGYKIEFFNPYINREHKIRRFTRRLPFYYLNKWDFNYENINKYSFIYIRKAWFIDGDLIKFIKNIKSRAPEIKIILEIPTYPYDNEGKQINMIPLIIKDKKWRKRLSKYVDRIVTYSCDENIFDIKTINVPNAIDMDNIRPRSTNKISNEINLIACSSLYYWHGYDRVIKGLNTYYKGRTTDMPIVKFHIVGDGEESEVYSKMIEKYELSKYIVMYGKLTGKELDKIYDLCDIALDSMGRHRSGVFYNSSLKGKEYCAKGMPIISGVKTELDSLENYNYYYRIEATDKELDIKEVIEFYEQVYFKEELYKEVIDNIVSNAKKYFDYPIAMRPIIEYIEE